MSDPVADEGKRFLSANELLQDSFRLAVQVLESGYRPHLVIGLWRGGAPVAIAVHEVLEYFGVAADHVPLYTSLYTGIDQRREAVRIGGLDAIADRDFRDKRILVVDDVFDTGLTLQRVLEALDERIGAQGCEVRTATVWWKPTSNLTTLAPDFFVHESAQWIVFPHELAGLSIAEILARKPGAEALRTWISRTGAAGVAADE